MKTISFSKHVSIEIPTLNKKKHDKSTEKSNCGI